MKIEIIAKPMLCWNANENQAKKYYVLAKVTQINTDFSFKAINSDGDSLSFMHAKPIPETVKMTVKEISEILGKTIEIVE